MSSQTTIDQRVQDLHRQAIIIDGHSDILMQVHEGKMDLSERQNVPEPATWQPPMGLENHPLTRFGISPHGIYFGSMGQYDIPQFQEAGLTAQVCAIYLDDHLLPNGLRVGLEMAWHLRHTAEQNPDFELITTAADIRRLKAEGKTGGILSFEGADALGGDIRMLDVYHALGLRSVSLTHTRRNIWADGCYAADQIGGLTSIGKQLIKRLNDLKIVVDLVHIGEPAFWEIMDLTTAPPVLSHSTPTMFHNSDPDVQSPLSGFPRPRLEIPRDRAMLQAIAGKGGVLGIIWALQETLDDVVRDVETALDVMGPDHIGLGSDLCGWEIAPPDLNAIAKLPNLTRRLVERGHSDEMLIKFLGGNYLRVFEEVWGK